MGKLSLKGFIEEVRTRYHDNMSGQEEKRREGKSGREENQDNFLWWELAEADTEKWVQVDCGWKDMYGNRTTPQHCSKGASLLLKSSLCSDMD